MSPTCNAEPSGLFVKSDAKAPRYSVIADVWVVTLPDASKAKSFPALEEAVGRVPVPPSCIGALIDCSILNSKSCRFLVILDSSLFNVSMSKNPPVL